MGRHSLNFLKLREHWPKDGPAAREVVTAYSMTFLINGSIRLLLGDGQIVTTPHPSNGKCLGA